MNYSYTKQHESLHNTEQMKLGTQQYLTHTSVAKFRNKQQWLVVLELWQWLFEEGKESNNGEGNGRLPECCEFVLHTYGVCSSSLHFRSLPSCYSTLQYRSALKEDWQQGAFWEVVRKLQNLGSNWKLVEDLSSYTMNPLQLIKISLHSVNVSWRYVMALVNFHWLD